ncbi:MAG TPA: MmgE/PrpD family protein [Hyphomicrobiales bacterium]|nr:MmgE/PrpD family protein [Hyphomicrobiales bacterium]
MDQGVGVSRVIARHVVGTRFDALPAEAVAAAKASLLDAVGVTLAASSLGEAAAPFAEIARQAEHPRGATVIGFGFKAAPAMAAFANGAMAHSLDYEDTFDEALVHPNAAVVPAALAVAETARAPIDGRELIAAIALGADLSCRLGLAVDGHERPGTSVRFMAGALAATAAAGRLLGLDENRLIEAFALAQFQIAFPSETMGYAPSHMRAVREAFAAKAGVLAAQLAAGGVRAFDKPFEGRHGFFGLYTDSADGAERLLDGLGRDFPAARVSFKPWPSCRGTHAFIEAALWMVESEGVRPDAVAAAEAVISPFFRALCEPPERKRRPATAIDAKFSVPFTVATALGKGRVGLDCFDTAAMADGATLALADRIGHRVETGWNTAEATRGVLNLTTRDGRMLSRSIEAPLGHPDHPMSPAAMAAKFAECATYARVPLDGGRADRIAETVAGLERVSDVASLIG